MHVVKAPQLLFLALLIVLRAPAPVLTANPPPDTGLPLAAAGATRSGPAWTAQSGDRAAIDRAIAAVYPSLVRISVVALQWSGGREIKIESSGSGTIVSADGYVVTNHHVAGRVERIICTLPTHEEIPAELVGTDPLSDIAVLKLLPGTPRKFPAAKFGTSAGLERGDPVLAMGSPLALSQSVTRGIVSNTDMMMPSAFGNALGLLDGEDVGTVVKWIGHDAAIYPGNSGGPLVNLAGEIVGVNEISFGLGGAIPADLARHVFEAIRRDGRVRRAWLGIELQPRVSRMTGRGALVSWVAEGSPAEAAGVEAGDLLVRVNDDAVDVRFVEQMPAVNQLLLGLPLDRPARLALLRGGRTIEAALTPAERPVASSLPAELRAWGLVASEISASEAREMGRASADGVRVVSLRPGGPATQAKPALARMDVILELDGHPIRSLADLEARTGELLGARDKTDVLVAFDRGLERRLTVVEIGPATMSEPGRDARKAWVPVAVQVLTPSLADRLGLTGRTGVRVTRVIDHACPLRVGDIITAIDEEPVRATTPTDEDAFAADIRRYRIGATVMLAVHRDGRDLVLPVVLGTSPDPVRNMPSYEDADFEFRARDLAATDRDDPRLRSGWRGGVYVDSVSQGGWAALARLAVGDVILAVDGHLVAGVSDLAARMEAIGSARPESVVFHVRRGIRTMFLELRPSWR
jgi:serine protease Do